MKPFGIFLLTSMAATALAGCDGSANSKVTATADGAVEVAAVDAPAGQSDNQAAAASHGERLSADAPSFASLYPAASLNQPVITANGTDGPGGMAEFTTVASPDEVVAHYRRLADEAGLKPVMAMNQGNARAFAALNTKGAEVQVVASPDEEGSTSVQLTWKNGQ